MIVIKSASERSHTAEHCWKYNHEFDWEHIKKVLDFEKNWKTETIKEAIYSEKNEHNINTVRKQSKENNCQNHNIIQCSPQRSTNKYGSTYVCNQSQPIRNDLKIFRSPVNT